MAGPDLFAGPTVWLALFAYAGQIYADFAGYSDIAIGSARLLGFELPENFRHPYLADSPSDFWRRWHITLSTWLRDYLYIPLGGSRGSSFATALTLVVTGEFDAIIPPHNASLLAATLPNAEAFIVPGVGHIFPIEAPELTNQMLYEFLNM
jgi:pimeloyl-ACP methyl ester carboxylesterase